MTKAYRHGQILNLIRNQPIRTQEDMAQALQSIGIAVTQVTLSRDIRELGLVKGPQGYREPETPEFEILFQEFSSRGRRSPKVWADAYLAAFAKVSGLTLVTFDRAFRNLAAVHVTVL